MTPIHLLQLLILASFWGGSFLFMRIAAPVIGPALLIELRLFLAALLLLAIGLFLKQRLQWRQHWRHYCVLGLLNSALPFMLLAWAAQTLTASLLSIINATAPIWGTLLIAIRYRQQVGLKAITGLSLGITGVALLVGFDPVMLQQGSLAAVIACLGAAISYGIASCYVQGRSGNTPYANAHGSMWGGTLVLLPLLPLFPATVDTSPEIVSSVLVLGIVCTGLAYLLYFRLIESIGAASALSVTYLVPLFGVFWGFLILDEPVGWHTLSGTLIVLTGTALVTGFNPATLLKRKDDVVR